MPTSTMFARTFLEGLLGVDNFFLVVLVILVVVILLLILLLLFLTLSVLALSLGRLLGVLGLGFGGLLLLKCLWSAY